jgi:tetratricopeptide (TPR) repeat protein
MRLKTRIAALHSAYWGFDRWYRLSWYIWPASLALLICGWIFVEKPGGPAATAPASWAKPATNAPPQPIRRSPVLANWPEKLQNDVASCFSNAIDLAPLIEACTHLIESGETDNRQLVMAYNQRGVHQRLKTPDRALLDYNTALSLQPNEPMVLTNRAFIYLSRNQYAIAIEDLNKAIEQLPAALAARPYYYRGFGYFKLMDDTRAMSDLNQSLKLDSSAPDPYLFRGQVEQRQKLYDDALRDFDEHIKRAPRDARGFVGRSEILQATGRIAEALTAMENAVTVAPDNAAAWARRDALRTQLNNNNSGNGGGGD